MNCGCAVMFEVKEKRKAFFLRLYDVFIQVESTLPLITEKMKEYIINEGSKIVLSKELQTKPKPMI